MRRLREVVPLEELTGKGSIEDIRDYHNWKASELTKAGDPGAKAEWAKFFRGKVLRGLRDSMLRRKQVDDSIYAWKDADRHYRRKYK